MNKKNNKSYPPLNKEHTFEKETVKKLNKRMDSIYKIISNKLEDDDAIKVNKEIREEIIGVVRIVGEAFEQSEQNKKRIGKDGEY